MSFHYSPKIVTDGLVLMLDAANPKSYSGSNDVLLDISRRDNHGMLMNGATIIPEKNIGSVRVEGTNYISVEGMPTGITWSLMMWSLIEGPTTFTVAGHRTYASTDNFRFQWDDKGPNSAYAPFTDFAEPPSNITGFVNKSEEDLFNKWNMVAMTCDGSTIQLYWNGILSTTRSEAKIFSNDGRMHVGLNSLSGIGGIDPFNRDGGECYFGPVMVYDQGLTPEQIQQNYNATKSRFI